MSTVAANRTTAVRWRAPLVVAAGAALLAGLYAALLLLGVALPGERVELARVRLTGSAAQRWFLAALAALVAGTTAATLWPRSGAFAFGTGLLAVVAWLVVFDVARQTVRARGLPRYIAVGLLAAYGWLALAGVLWAGAGQTVAGARYDAAAHAVFLGFTMSMIFVHAPVILPAVLRRPLPYRPILYLPLTLLHASLLVRVGAGDAAGWEPAWRWSGILNVASVVAFAACAATLAVAGRVSTMDVYRRAEVAR